MDKAEAAAKSAAASKVFLDDELYENAGVIMLYMPLGNETDTTEIISKAFSDGKKLVFPVTDKENGEITPCYAGKETVFAEGAFSVREPAEKDVADVSEIDVIVVPGIAFDKKGSRIGFGKGCYDRFLKNCPAVKIGFCYDFQAAHDIPTEPHDIKMDFLITENGKFKCE